METKRRPGPEPHFGRRLVLYESPAVVAELAERARAGERSVAAEVREALRAHLARAREQS